MADCTDNDTQKVSAAFPAKNTEDSPTGLQVNECAFVNPAFDMTAMLSASKNYMKLNESVNKLIGSEVRWFRAVPQQRSKDVIFMEYTLSNVDDTPLCIKVMLPDGNFPDSKYNYDLMGLEYEIPLEIQIDKHYWETTVGYGTAPQKKDIVYFSVPNKLYQVESAYMFRGFMEQETAWKLNLRKYSPESSRREGEVLKQTIDQYTTSTEEIFGDMQNQDINKIVNDRQNSPYNSTSEDKYKIWDDSLKIVTSSLEIYGIKVAQSYYDLNTSTETTAVTYNIVDNIHIDDDRCLSLWMKPNLNDNKEYVVSSIVMNGDNYTIIASGLDCEVGDIVHVYRAGSVSFYATYITGNEFYIEPKILSYLQSIKIDWYTLKNWKVKKDIPINLLQGHNQVEALSISIDIFGGQFIRVIYGSQEHICILPDKLIENDWHGFILNIGNSWNQFNLYIWKQQDIDDISKLYNLYYETLKLNSEEVSVYNYHIIKSNANITNIRWYNSNMEEEKQTNELLSYFVKDGDHTIIADNVDPLYKSPYIARQR